MEKKEEKKYIQMEIPYLEIFQEKKWPQFIPKKYLINACSVEIDHEDTQFLIDDCTNPNFQQFKIKNHIDTVIKDQLNGQAFMKVYGRTGKDIHGTMNKILSCEDLTMSIKMSQFLTQAFDEQLQMQKQQLETNSASNKQLNFILRQYKDYLQNEINQFRLYLIDGRFVGMCQKVPNHVSQQPNEQQIVKAKQVVESIWQSIQKILLKTSQSQKGQRKQQEQKQVSMQEKQTKNEIIQKIQIVIDCFISLSGKKAKILSIQPLEPLNCLSLFSVQQLRANFQTQGDIKPLVKWVKDQSEYKQVDLSNYRLGAQLANHQALQEWKQFIKGK